MFWDGSIVHTYGFLLLFFLASAVAAAGPLDMATRAAMEVLWEVSLEVLSADMGGILSVRVVGVRGSHLLLCSLGWHRYSLYCSGCGLLS